MKQHYCATPATRIENMLLTVAIAVLLLVFAPVDSPFVAHAQDEGNVSIIGGDVDSMRRFISRTEGFFGIPNEATVTIHIAELTGDLPFDLPLPDDIDPVGSIATAIDDMRLIQLIMDTALSPEEVADFYAENLAEEPWQSSAGMNSTPGGFTSADIVTLMYCYDDITMLNINATTLSSGITDLQFHINQQEGTFMCQGGIPGRDKLNATSLLPKLESPPDISEEYGISQNMPGPGNTYSAISTAILTSTMDAADMLDTYNEQVLAAGWELVQQEAGAAGAWSVWTFTDELDNLWHGTLTITPDADTPDTYQAVLHITQQEDGD